MTDPRTSQPSPQVPVFDGHNDTILNLMATGRSFFERSHEGHIDLPRAREGGLFGGFFAVFLRDPEVMPTEEVPDPRRTIGRYSDPAKMPAPMELEYAQRQTLRALGTLVRLEDASDGALRIVGVGLTLGLAAAAILSSRVAPLLYEVSPLDPFTFAAVMGLLLATAAAASWIPAIRAARLNPNVCLNQSA